MQKVKANVEVFRDQKRRHSILTKRPGVKLLESLPKTLSGKILIYKKYCRMWNSLPSHILYIFNLELDFSYPHNPFI